MADNEVFEHIKQKGDFDAIKRSLLEELRKDETFKKLVAEKIAKSQAMQRVNLDKVDKKQLMKDVREEVETELHIKATDLIWEMMTNSEGNISKSIDASVIAALNAVTQTQAPPGH